ncbi:class I SAM-dependent rRNA methyltransferase [Calorimonas adulescens]|uniref:Class I SAM-dependent rRNA methyltransferase n=1 Tax=Calorimonas adulescens TaxID=2606906 RepID=A0A5D8QGX7_9THEO|nr:class I SAM-dependent rRNA methyltransferase [Calorimonas adulescens]TZE83424.1 class I SAM-dependent rRNA methyltransferase [Calorimonas adulescens]
MAKLYLKRINIDRILNGHPWIFDNEISLVEGEYSPGDVVEVYDYKKKFIGKGFISPKSKIRIRLLTRNKDENIDENFIRNKVVEACEYRKRIMDISSCRLIYGEADGLPGLIVDKFGDYLVLQSLTIGIEKFKQVVVDVLIDIIAPKGIYERNDVPVRELEGIKQQSGYLYGSFDPMQQFEENGLKFWVDMKNGQKTGYFLDQKENRMSIKSFVQGANVLDCFCNTGSFSVHAAFFGAASVMGIDISPNVLEIAKKNAELNNVSEICTFKEANVFDMLKEYDEEGKKYDVIILDPPAFTKSSKTVGNAYRGYKEINLRAMKLLPPGGILITSSCSQHINREEFLNIIVDAARDTKRKLRLIEFRGQAKDHPILPASRETNYLKFAILEVR